ncbi:MAG: pyridoxamine 5'-phosphate oxidase family protein [Sporomusaceae bacterium]|nr:pyridoxamine 5'-phosphate oxidase family protein [Sporomusaceae bacterium]
MLNDEIISILKTQVCFLGTSHENVPRVRPMRPFVSEEGTIWLISYTDTEKTREIEANNVVELCAVDENSNVLRLQGKLVGEEKLLLEEKEKVRRKIIEELPGAEDFFSGFSDSAMAIYKFEISNLVFRTLENVARAELHFRR